MVCRWGIAVLGAVLLSACASGNPGGVQRAAEAPTPPAAREAAPRAASRQLAAQKPHCAKTPYGVAAPAGYRHDLFAPAKREVYMQFGAFASSFDGHDDDDGDGRGDLKAVPEWVAYELRALPQRANGVFVPAEDWERPRPWYEHPALSFALNQPDVTAKGLDRSYAGTGDVWNRGHMAMRSHGDRLGPKYGCDTHVFFNAVPQSGNLNQGDWRLVEEYTGALANKFGAVWIMAGPVYHKPLAQEPTIGGPGEVKIPIPDELYKVVVWRQADGWRSLGFLYPNVENYHKGCSADRLSQQAKRLVPVERIEALTGLTFFTQSDLSADEQTRLRKTTPKQLPEVEAHFFEEICGMLPQS